mgnify:CR=1 FL=1
MSKHRPATVRIETALISNDPYVYRATLTHKGRDITSAFESTRSAAKHAVSQSNHWCLDCGHKIMQCACG